MSPSSDARASAAACIQVLILFSTLRAAALPLTHSALGAPEPRLLESRLVVLPGGEVSASEAEGAEMALFQSFSSTAVAAEGLRASARIHLGPGHSPMPFALDTAKTDLNGLGVVRSFALQFARRISRDAWQAQNSTLGTGGFPESHSPGWAIQRDIFPQQYELLLFNAASSSEWTILLSTVSVLLLLELFVLRRMVSGGNASFIAHVCLLCFWIAAGMGYNVYFAFRYGRQDAVDWFTGYWLEWMLCMDNLFVFHLIFQVYKTPHDQTSKALFVGIIGAVCFKLVFFLALGTAMTYLHWVRVLFGLVLIWSGVQAARESGGDDVDIEQTWGVRSLKLLLGDRLIEKYDEDGRAFVWGEDGRLRATMLCYVILCLEASDVIFAVDSVSAKIAVIPNLYVAFSSSVLATFALRAQYFVIRDLVTRFTYLRYGLCFILVFLGVELVFSYWMHLDSATVCGVIFAVFFVCVLASEAERQTTAGATQISDGSGDGPRQASSDGSGAASEMLPREAVTCRL